MPDNLHPADDVQQLMADRFAERVFGPGGAFAATTRPDAACAGPSTLRLLVHVLTYPDAAVTEAADVTETQQSAKRGSTGSSWSAGRRRVRRRRHGVARQR